MSWLTKAFGAPKNSSGGGGPQISKARAAADMLQDQIELMDKKIEHYERLGREQQKLAKSYGTKTAEAKKKALRCLKNYKKYMNDCKQIEGQRDNLDAQKSALDMSMMAAGNIEAMKVASSTIAQQINIDEAEETVDQIQDHMDQVNEVVSTISQPMSGTVVDEDELMDELADFIAEDDDVDELTKEMAGIDADQMPSVDTMEPLPNPITTAPKKTEEQAQLDDLAAWMN